MDYRKIADGIQRYIENKPDDHTAYVDLLSLCRQWEEEDFQSAHDLNGELRRLCARQLHLVSPKEADKFYEAWRKSPFVLLKSPLIVRINPIMFLACQ